MRIKGKLQSITSVFLLIVSLFVHSSSISATSNGEAKSLQPVSVLQVAPIMNDLAVKPGEMVRRQLTVTNLARIPLPMKAYSRAFIAIDEYGGSDTPDDTNPNSVQHWFTFENPDFILQPEETKSINYTITIPEDARPGGHYATIFVESLLPKEVLTETSLYLSSRIGALFFFVVAGDLVEKGSVTELKTKGFQQSGPISFEIAFKNEGNVDLTPKSMLTITNWQGKVVYTTEDKGNRTLPERTRRWKLTWDKNFLIGKYTAKLETKNTIDAKTQTTEIQFFIFPVVQTILAILGILFIYLVFFKGRKRMLKALYIMMGKENGTLDNVKEDTDIATTLPTLQTKHHNESTSARATTDFGLMETFTDSGVKSTDTKDVIDIESPLKQKKSHKFSDETEQNDSDESVHNTSGPILNTIEELKIERLASEPVVRRIRHTAAKAPSQIKKQQQQTKNNKQRKNQKNNEHSKQVKTSKPKPETRKKSSEISKKKK